MAMPTHPTIWMKPEQDSQGACAGQDEGQPCLTPALSGPQEFVQHALRALNRVIEPRSGCGLVDLNVVKSLHIGDGECVLVLTSGSHTGHDRQLADDAFHALCQALPDTDIYVRHEV